MRCLIVISLSIIFSNLNLVSAKVQFDVRPRVIYGIDDRSDVYDSSDSLLRDLSHSVAAQITDMDLIDMPDGSLDIVQKTLIDKGVCETERFAKQSAVASCSGFLIGADVLVTAGHCVRDANQCQTHRWIFDYANYEKEEEHFNFKKEQVFRCTKLIARSKDQASGLDFAIVKLDRAPKGRRPLKVRTTGKLSDDAILTVLGFPSGIPLKITTGASIRDNSKKEFFVINSDTYSGNSGSPVIDTKTGIVEGILVRGDNDYVIKSGDSCLISNVNTPDSGRGEDATRITAIKSN